MTPDLIVQMVRSALSLAIVLTIPVLAVALAVSVCMSLLQALTSMQENTIATVPRLLCAGVAAVCVAPWTLQKLCAFTQQIFVQMARFAK